MLNRIIKFSLNNRFTILIISLLLIVVGSYTAHNMEVDVFPDLNAPTVVVMTEAEGMAAEEVERLVTMPIEIAVNGSTGVRRVRSTSTTGFSSIWVEFEWGTDIYRARQIVSEKLATATESLPEGVGKPTMGPQSSILGEVMFVGLTADTTSMQDLRTIADITIRQRLLSIGGVAQVAVLGGDIKEYQILISPEKLKYFDISINQVVESVKEMNRNTSGGVHYEYGNEYIIRGVVSTLNCDDMAQTVVKHDGDNIVLLSDIASVKIGAKSPQTGVASINGKPAVLLTVTKQPQVGTIELTEKLDQAVEEIKNQLPSDIKVNTQLYRQQRFIDSSIGNIKKSLLEGAVFVTLVLFIFLMNVRTTFISLLTIPLSLLVTILTLKLFGLTINTMSIGGMAIAIGALVDDAIVDVENVYKHIKLNRKLTTEQQQPLLKVIFEASREVRLPILNSTLIIVVSFVPLFFLSGMEGRMLAPLGVAFIVSLFASTLVALTLTPVLCSFLLGRSHPKGADESHDSIVVRHLKTVYRKALLWTISHRWHVLSVSGVAVIASLVMLFTFGRSFLPPFNEGSMTINVSTMPGVSLEESDKIGRRAEMLLLGIPEVESVARKTGRAELDEHALGVNTSEIEAPFELQDRSKEEMVDEMRRVLSTIPGISIEIGQPISHRIDAMLSGTRANIAIKLFGDDLNRMYAIANEIKNRISTVEGIADLNVEQQVERPQLQIVPRRQMLARYGITPGEFASYVNILLGGEVVSQVYDGNFTFDITVKGDQDSRATIERIKDLTIDGAGGVKIPMSQIADVVSSSGPNSISRENVSRKIVVSVNISGGDLRTVVNDIQEKVSDLELPPNYHIEYGGQFESEQTASRTLLITSLVSILVIFLLLFKQFRSIGQSLVVLFNLPLALIGGVFAIFITGGVLSIPALIGFISLFGIATRNGMLLMDRYNELQKSGRPVIECVMEGSLDRMNPIIMTALTSALALIPLAVGGDLPGNEIQSPMAIVMLGGLLSSTILNGFIIPIMYLLMNRR